MKTVITKEIEKLLKQKAAMILNCFGYVNLKPQNIKVLDYSNYTGFYEFILVEFENIKIQLTYEHNYETKSWNLLDRTEEQKGQIHGT